MLPRLIRSVDFIKNPANVQITVLARTRSHLLSPPTILLVLYIVYRRGGFKQHAGLTQTVRGRHLRQAGYQLRTLSRLGRSGARERPLRVHESIWPPRPDPRAARGSRHAIDGSRRACAAQPGGWVEPLASAAPYEGDLAVRGPTPAELGE